VVYKPVIYCLLAANVLIFAGCQKELGAVEKVKTQPNISETTQPHPSPKNTDESIISSDDEEKAIQSFFQDAINALSEDPTNREFGFFRIRPTHSITSSVKSSKKMLQASKSFEEVRKYREASIILWGEFEFRELRRRSSFAFKDQYENFQARKRPEYSKEYQSSVYSWADKIAEEVYKENTGSKKIVRSNEPIGILEARPVFASSEKCYTCHTNVPKGKPIGVLGIFTAPKRADKPPKN